MKWNKYSFKTDNDKVDILSALLADAGIEGVEIEDNVPISDEDTKGMFIDILPERGEDDGTATINFYHWKDSQHYETAPCLQSPDDGLESNNGFVDRYSFPACRKTNSLYTSFEASHHRHTFRSSAFC